MGCDIHAKVEVKQNNQWSLLINFHPTDKYDKSEVFNWRSYGLYGFLANVRNYSRIPCITTEPRGLPNDISKECRALYDRWDLNAHSVSWLLLNELLDFDYEQTFEDLRYTKQEGNITYGNAIAEKGQGEIKTFREFLGEGYFNELAVMKTICDNNKMLYSHTRIVFWFDN